MLDHSMLKGSGDFNEPSNGGSSYIDTLYASLPVCVSSCSLSTPLPSSISRARCISLRALSLTHTYTESKKHLLYIFSAQINHTSGLEVGGLQALLQSLNRQPPYHSMPQSSSGTQSSPSSLTSNNPFSLSQPTDEDWHSSLSLSGKRPAVLSARISPLA